MTTPTEASDTWNFQELIARELSSPSFVMLGTLRAEIPRVGRARVALDVVERLMQAEGVVHGGVIYTLADSAIAMALHSNTRHSQPLATIEAKINYLAPVTEGELIAEAVVEHQGRTTAVIRCDVTNVTAQRTQRVALVQATFAILAPRKQQMSD